jgi:aspartyl protease family protein
MLGWLVAVLAALVVLFWQLGAGDGIDSAGDKAGYLVYAAALGAIAILYIVSISSDYRGRWRVALRHAAIWTALGLGLITVYTYREEARIMTSRIASEVLPPGQAVNSGTGAAGEVSVRLRKRPDGHFIARVDVQGTTLGFLVDTGASTVVLKPGDAEKAGIDVSALAFTVAVETANGTTFAAPVRLRSVAIGPIELNDVEALVAKPGNLKENLLGMSFLKRLRSYEASGDFLTLRG